jgi:hypothetical protein
MSRAFHSATFCISNCTPNSWQPWLLVGETPLLAAMADIAFGNAFAKQQMHLLANQARPSAVRPGAGLSKRARALGSRSHLSTDGQGLGVRAARQGLLADLTLVDVDRKDLLAGGVKKGGSPIVAARAQITLNCINGWARDFSQKKPGSYSLIAVGDLVECRVDESRLTH